MVMCGKLNQIIFNLLWTFLYSKNWHTYLIPIEKKNEY